MAIGYKEQGCIICIPYIPPYDSHEIELQVDEKMGVDIAKNMACAFILTSQECTTACTRTSSVHRLGSSL
jgi:hypothetical protein